MSDSEHSMVTYTSISSDDGSLDVGSPGVIVYGYDRMPMIPEDPYAYVKAAMQEPPPLYFVHEPVYPEFMPPEDDVLPTEEQPLPAAISPTADSPGYITKSDPKEDPEEADDEDPEEDPTDYPKDRDDEEEEESSGGDADDEDEDEGEDEDEEENLDPSDSVPPPIYHATARMSIQAQTPIPFLFEAEVDRLLAIPTLPPSLVTSISSPLPRIPSPPLPLSSPLPLPPPIVHPRTRASMVMMRADTPSTYCLAPPSGTPPLLPIPLCTSSPPLLLPFNVRRADVLESSSAPTARSTGGFKADYGFVGTLDAEIRRDLDREIDINSVNGKQPMAEVNRNATPKSTDMSHRGGETDQNVDAKKFTPHYFPKVRESAPVKPHHVNEPSSSRNSKKESYGATDMAHNYHLEEAKKKIQDKNRNLKPREMPFAKTHHIPNACTPKPKSNNQTSRNWHASKSCEETLKAVQKTDHSRNPSSFSDFKHFVCSTCQKCVFNANHDACITKFLKEVNSHAKIQPNKTTNSNKPVDPTSHTQKPTRKIIIGHSLSPNKSFVMHEKTNTPRSCLRWIPTCRIFNTAGLKWVPTGKTFTTKVNCEPPN
nr:hypothetical protein [Tanacetum cinerariifolium]